MKRILTFAILVALLVLISIPATAAEDSITINPLGILNEVYIVDYEHTIKGNAALNGCVSSYNSSSDDLSGFSISAGFKQYYESDAQAGKYFGLSATYYDISKAHDIWFVDEGTAFAIMADFGYRYIYESGFTVDFGIGAGCVKREGENRLILSGRVQTGYGW
jgi:hypothetical protein